MFKRGDKIYCIKNKYAPDLKIGKSYTVYYTLEGFLKIDGSHSYYLKNNFGTEKDIRQLKLNNLKNKIHEKQKKNNNRIS